ncbi:MAG: radical SAM protein [bacterium]
MIEAISLIEIDRNQPTSYIRKVVNEIGKVPCIRRIVLCPSSECDFGVVKERLWDIVGENVLLMSAKGDLEELRTALLNGNKFPNFVLRIKLNKYPLEHRMIDSFLKYHINGGHKCTRSGIIKPGVPSLEAIRLDNMREFFELYIDPLRGVNGQYDSLFKGKGCSFYKLSLDDYKFYLEDHFDDLWSTPEYLVIEPTNMCNLRCKKCYYYTGSFAKFNSNRDKMDFQTFKKVIDDTFDVRRDVKVVIPYIGEPFLHSDIMNMIRYIKGKDIELLISTNGVLLDNEKISDIVKLGVDSIVITIDGATPESYMESHGAKRGHFERVVKNIEDLVNTKRNYGSPITICINHVVRSGKEDEFNLLFERWSKYLGDVIITESKLSITTESSLTGFITVKFEDKFMAPPYRGLCVIPWNRAVVLASGDVVICDILYYGKHIVMGNVHESSIPEIWRGKKYMDFRKAFLEEYTGRNSLCGECESWYCIVNTYTEEIRDGLRIVTYPHSRVYSKSAQNIH